MNTPVRYWLQVGRDACREMFIMWQTGEEHAGSAIEYRRFDQMEWQHAAGTHALHPYTEPGNEWRRAVRYVHRTLLSGLTPGATYEFRFPGDSAVFQFWTLPDVLNPARPVRAVVGGDLYSSSNTVAMTAQAMAHNPDFVVIDGDLAYADGLGSQLHLWDRLWDILRPGLTTPDGRIVPLVPVIGNHEVVGGYSDNKADAPYFYSYFDMPEEHAGAYFEVWAGDWLTMLALDSEHTSGNYTGSSPQEVWLAERLEASHEIKHRLALLHVTYYSGGLRVGTQQERGIDFIAPLLEDAGVRTAFVGHDHLYHRTHRIAGSEVVPETDRGVRYFGDGAWGAALRMAPNHRDAWYTDELYSGEDDPAKACHVYVLAFHPHELVVESLGLHEVFHTHREPVVTVGRPEIISASRAGTAVIVEWTEVAGAVEYRIYARAPWSRAKWERVGTSTTARAGVEVPEEASEIAVAAVSDLREGALSAPVTVKATSKLRGLVVQINGQAYPVEAEYIQAGRWTYPVQSEVVHRDGYSHVVWER